LAQKTVLILGYGSIAKSISPALRAMGMNVLGVRRTAADPDQGIYTLDSLHELLPKAQVLLVTLPATDETSGLLGKDEFDLLPDGAIVVNVGRAQVIDQHAFYDTLKSG
jgi:phosphoglycerate dehydrogenase-like enzyme